MDLRLKRVLAGFADLLVLTFISTFGAGLGAYFAGAFAVPDTSSKQVEQMLFTGMFVGLLFWGLTAIFLNFGLLQGIHGSSFGKLVFGLSVRTTNSKKKWGVGRSLIRTLLVPVSLLPFGIGFLRETPWHDDWSDSTVVEKRAKSKQQLSVLPGLRISRFKTSKLRKRRAG